MRGKPVFLFVYFSKINIFNPSKENNLILLSSVRERLNIKDRT